MKVLQIFGQQKASEPVQNLESDDNPEGSEADLTLEAHIYEEAFEKAHAGSQEASQSKSTFKYKSSHPKDLIIRNKDSP